MKRLLNYFRDHILEYLLIALLLGGVFYLAISKGSYAEPGSSVRTVYANKLFDDSRVHKVEITIDQKNLEALLENPREKERYISIIDIDGEHFADVAISTRGNGSLLTIANDETSERYSYTLNFHKFNNRGSYFGLDKLILNNLYSDPSYLKNYIAFKISAASGVESPLTSFTELYINGEFKGLYLAIEAIDQSFLGRTNSSRNASLYHPIPYNIDWDRIYRDEKYLPEGEIIDSDNHPDSSFHTYGGADLVYRGNDPSLYASIFENAATKYSRADEELIIKAIESLSEFTDLNPADYWDIDSVIRFFVSNALVPNADSYVSSFAQNYYLKLSNGKLSVIPWDFDRAFRLGHDEQSESFGMGETETTFSNDVDDLAVNWSIDSPLIGYSEEERPLWRLVASNPEYLEKYHTLLQETLDNYLLNGEARKDFDDATELIRDYVYRDPSKFFSDFEFESEVEYLNEFILLRSDSIQKQLWDIPLDDGKKTDDEPSDLRIVDEN